MSSERELRRLLPAIRSMHDDLRDRVVAETERSASARMAEVVRDGAGDTIYGIDCVSEERLTELVTALGRIAPVVVIAEGLSGGPLVVPEGTPVGEARWRMIVDPIDGTRGLMYQKRSAWILTGVAPNHGDATRLSDIVLAVQTEVPTIKQHLCDQLWAIAGEGAGAERYDRVSGQSCPLALAPSSAATIEHGFAQVARFFPGARDELAAIDDEIARELLGPLRAGKALCFEDQYVSSGGQLYELMAGHDRFCADLRPLTETLLAARGESLGICCHPYDLCTELIARELGVAVTDPSGGRLDCVCDLDSDVAWVGYANETLRSSVEPVLQAALRRRGLLP